MLNWSTGTWHRRLTEWTYGSEMFLGRRTNLCPYMRRLVIAIIAAPFLFVFRLLDKKVWAQVTFIAVTLNLIIAGTASLLGAAFLAALTITAALTLGSFGVLGLIAVFIVLKEKLEDRAKRKRNEKREAERKAIREGTYKSKGPNPLTAFINAKHEKICPMIEWTEEKKETAPSQPAAMPVTTP